MSQDIFVLYTPKTTNGGRMSHARRCINIAEDPEKYIKFLSPDELKPGKESANTIKQLHQLWWKTTYLVDFCEEKSMVDTGSAAPNKDELMDSMERVLNPADRKLLAPPDTTRVVFGFCPPRHFRCGRSLYMDAHSRPAYDRLKRFVRDRGSCRLGAGLGAGSPVQEYPEPDYGTPPCRQGKPPPTPTWIHLQPDPHT